MPNLGSAQPQGSGLRWQRSHDPGPKGDHHWGGRFRAHQSDKSGRLEESTRKLCKEKPQRRTGTTTVNLEFGIARVLGHDSPRRENVPRPDREVIKTKAQSEPRLCPCNRPSGGQELPEVAT